MLPIKSPNFEVNVAVGGDQDILVLYNSEGEWLGEVKFNSDHGGYDFEPDNFSDFSSADLREVADLLDRVAIVMEKEAK